ncbi:hypothetical protein J4231_00610 [Candidatus Woesearchaeota archaeon]|nr:hypothetical protein [Candidatus Woesearchaeota archaeon]
MEYGDENNGNEKKGNANKWLVWVVVAIALVIAFNAYQLSNVNSGTTQQITGSVVQSTNSVAVNTQNTQAALDVLPKGVPDVYGQELGVSYDDVSSANPSLADSTIRKVGSLENQISLSGNDMNRYISIAGKISCEYCCETESIISSNGQAACECAHSSVMRGLAKYLVKNHGSEYTDDEILEELGKWKTLFFPEKIAEKAAVLKSKGIELNYINLASNKYRDIEKK